MTVVKLAALAGVGIVSVAFYGAAVEFGIFVLEAADSELFHLGVGAYIVLRELAVFLQKEDAHPEDAEAQDYCCCKEGCHLSNSGLMDS